MKLKKILGVVLAVCAVGAMTIGCKSNNSSGTTVKPGQALPRNQTMYFDGLAWGAPASFSPLNQNACAFPVAGGSLARELTYETLFMYNQLDGKMYPLLGKSYQWNSDNTELTVKLNKDAHWNDGKPVTADDVAYTFNLGKKYNVSWNNYWTYLDSVTATDKETVVFKVKSTNPNPLMVDEAIESVYIVPQHIWSAIEEKDHDNGTMVQAEVNPDPVGSGPYKIFYYNDTKVELVRDDNYWGKASSMWGKLPAPKYMVHNIFNSNADGDAALKQGEIDVSQQFSAQVWTFGANVKTYLSSAPYYIPSTIPWIIFNTTKPGLDNAKVRLAIANAINYDKIGQNAMSGYTSKMSPSLMVATDVETKLIDQDKLAPYQWKGNDAADANKLLDEVAPTKNASGIRLYNGKPLSFSIEVPDGWSDWNATCQEVADDTKAIGVEIKTNFPQQPTYTSDMQTGSFDIVMQSYQGPGISSPWARAYQALNSEDLAKVGTNVYRNYGHYSNADVDKLIDQIPTITDQSKLKDAWDQLNIDYLKDCPIIGSMYRPGEFYTVNTSVWSGFPKQGDGTNIPPQIAIDGYGVAALYHITAK